LFDALKKKPETEGNSAEQKTEDSESSGSESSGNQGLGKFNEVCALCGKGPTDVKWMGQYFHVKCKRSAKKMAKRMM
jgi:hypothetical protein